MSDDAFRHTDAVSWHDHWELVEPLKGGAQASACKVRGHDGTIAFIKELREPSNSERRARMHREALALERLSIKGIPRLLQSNAHHYASSAHKLYLAMEFIEGHDLNELVQLGAITPRDAINLTIRLLEIVQAMHDTGVVHRDLKPDNLRVSKPEAAYLPHIVDYGISFIDEPSSPFMTDIGQEMGNRFLRLPEHRSGGPAKRDRRSDITLCAGLLFFMLAKVSPRSLADENGMRPHQRPAERAALIATGLSQARLFAIFERAFSEQLALRFQTANELSDAVKALSESSVAFERQPVSLSDIVERLIKPVEQAVDRTGLRANRTGGLILEVAKQLRREMEKSVPAGAHLPISEPAIGIGGSAFGRAVFEIAIEEATPAKRFRIRVLMEATEFGDRCITTLRSAGVATLTCWIDPDQGLEENVRDDVRSYFIQALSAGVHPEEAALRGRALDEAGELCERLRDTLLDYLHECSPELGDRFRDPRIGQRGIQKYPDYAFSSGVVEGFASDQFRLKFMVSVWVLPRIRDDGPYALQMIHVNVEHLERKTSTQERLMSGCDAEPYHPSVDDLREAIDIGLRHFGYNE